MAIEINSLLKSEELRGKDSSIGIALPLQFGQNTFLQTYKQIDQIKYNIINLFKTRRTERIMHPEFGSNLLSFVFEQNDDNLPIRIEAEISETIERWLPYVNIGQVDVNFQGENSVSITISFKLVGDMNFNEVVIFAER